MLPHQHRIFLALPLFGMWHSVFAIGSTVTPATTTSGVSAALSSLGGTLSTPGVTSSTSNTLSSGSSTILLSSSAISSISSPTSTIVANFFDDARDSFWFPLEGLSDVASEPWGVNVTKLSHRHITFNDYDGAFTPYKIIVNNSNPVPSDAPELDDHQQVIAISGDDMLDDNRLVVTTNGDLTLVLGLNSYLNMTTQEPGVDFIIPTVPFGLNYGHKGVWNGSVSLGHMYDSNRVASSSWTLIAESAGGNSSFLQNGTLQTIASLEFRGVTTTFPAILDINSEKLVLPSSYNCSQVVAENLVVGIPNPNLTDSVLRVVVPSNLTSTTDRCITLKSHDPNNNKVILGRPFFQATYIYVDRDSRIFIASAHQYDLPISAANFSATATLVPAQEPAQPTDSSTGQESTGAWSMAGPSPVRALGIGWSLTILTLVASLIARNL